MRCRAPTVLVLTGGYVISVRNDRRSLHDVTGAGPQDDLCCGPHAMNSATPGAKAIVWPTADHRQVSAA